MTLTKNRESLMSSDPSSFVPYAKRVSKFVDLMSTIFQRIFLANCDARNTRRCVGLIIVRESRSNGILCD